MSAISIAANQVWACMGCGTPVVKDADRVPYLNFSGVHGAGYLFHDAFNITLGKAYEKEMTTGLHTIRDVACAKCNSYIGWKYEKAARNSQQYKIGKFLMEDSLLKQASLSLSKL